MALAPRVPRRGGVYSINPDPTSGRELRGRHFWLILTEEEVNRHGMVIAVAINTAAVGMREAGLAVPVSAGAVTGVAVLNQIRSFDIRARDQATGVTYEGAADPAVMADIATRVASLIDPEPPPQPQPKKREAKTSKGSLGDILQEALGKKK